MEEKNKQGNAQRTKPKSKVETKNGQKQNETTNIQQWKKPEPSDRKTPIDKSTSAKPSALAPLIFQSSHSFATCGPIFFPTKARYEIS